jgi:threonine dehydrogenase-like Zn-dependent dehydrogenase
MSETITVQNEALVVVGIDNIEIRKWKLELPAKQGRLIVPERHALIRIRATGICGSDVSIQDSNHGPLPYRY